MLFTAIAGFEVVEDLVYHRFSSNLILMRQVQTKVYTCFPHLLLQVFSFLHDSLHEWHHFVFYLSRTQVREVNGESLLDKFKHRNVILQNWIADALVGKPDERLE